MTGWEQLVAWLFGIVMATVTVVGVAKARSDAQIEAARLLAQAQRGPLFPPADWWKDGGS